MRYETTWRNKFLTTHVQSFDEMIETLESAVNLLKEMRADGVKLDPDGGTADDYALLYTEDESVAKKYEMEEEYSEEEWDEEEWVDEELNEEEETDSEI